MFIPLTIEFLVALLGFVGVALATANVWRWRRGAGAVVPAGAEGATEGDVAARFESKMVTWRRITQAAEHTLLDNIAATTPWLAPVVPAAIAYHNLVTFLEFNAWLAFVSALCIEFLGLSAVHTIFQVWQYNQARRAKDAEAPIKLAVGVGVAYLFIVLVVNALLEIASFEAWTWQGLTHVLAKALLSLLAAVSAFVLAIRAQQQRLIVEQAEDKAQRAEAAELGKLRQAVPQLKQKLAELQQAVKDTKQEATAAQRERDKLAKDLEQAQQAETALKQRLAEMEQTAQQAQQRRNAAEQRLLSAEQLVAQLEQERNGRETAEKQLQALAVELEQERNRAQQLAAQWEAIPPRYQAAVAKEVLGMSLRLAGEQYGIGHTAVSRAHKEWFGEGEVVLNGKH